MRFVIEMHTRPYNRNYVANVRHVLCVSVAEMKLSRVKDLAAYIPYPPRQLIRVKITLRQT